MDTDRETAMETDMDTDMDILIYDPNLQPLTPTRKMCMEVSSLCPVVERLKKWVDFTDEMSRTGIITSLPNHTLSARYSTQTPRLRVHWTQV
jgi:hypothetical protein